MKSILSKNCCEKKEKPFPKLMVSVDSYAIVLFTDSRIGVCVHGSTHNALGYYSETWCPSSFLDYEGDVTLSND